MNALNVGTPAATACGELGDWVVLAGGDHQADRDVDRAVAVRRRAPRAPARRGATGSAAGPAGPRVVEAEKRRRPAERGRHRVLEEPVGLGVAGDAGVGVDVDDARQDEQAARVDDLAGRRGQAGEVQLDLRDPPALHGDVRTAGFRPPSRPSHRRSAAQSSVHVR